MPFKKIVKMIKNCACIKIEGLKNIKMIKSCAMAEQHLQNFQTYQPVMFLLGC